MAPTDVWSSSTWVAQLDRAMWDHRCHIPGGEVVVFIDKRPLHNLIATGMI